MNIEQTTHTFVQRGNRKVEYDAVFDSITQLALDSDEAIALALPDYASAMRLRSALVARAKRNTSWLVTSNIVVNTNTSGYTLFLGRVSK